MDIEELPIQETDDYKRAYLYTIRLLTKRDYSQYKIKKKLREKDYPKEIIQPLIDELIELRYLREEEYANARVRYLMHKGHPPQFIQQKLRMEFVDVEIEHIELIFKDNLVTIYTQLDYLVKKKLRGDIDNAKDNLQDFNFKKKLLRYLVSKGHSFDHSNRAIDLFLKEIDEEINW